MADNSKDNDDVREKARARAAAMAKASSTPLSQVYRETIVELKKTTWPDAETLQKSVFVVLSLIAATSIWTFFISFIMGKIAARLFGISEQ